MIRSLLKISLWKSGAGLFPKQAVKKEDKNTEVEFIDEISKLEENVENFNVNINEITNKQKELQDFRQTKLYGTFKFLDKKRNGK